MGLALSQLYFSLDAYSWCLLVSSIRLVPQIMKYFATMEVQRLKSVQNQRSYAARERQQEDEAKAQQEKEMEFEQVRDPRLVAV